MKNILVTIDFDDNEGHLLEKAAELAGGLKTKLWLLHAAAADPDFVGYGVGPQYIRDARAEDLREEHRELQKLANDFQEKGIEAEGLLIQGATIETVMQEAQNLRADMIIAGHREHNILYKVFTGSVSNSIIKKSKIPVLIVPIG